MKKGKPNVSREVWNAVTFWQAALRLQDWHFLVARATPETLRAQSAEIAIFPTFKRATIYLSTLSKLDGKLEADIVHELLHVVFLQASQHFGAKPVEEQIFNEQGLNSVADLLVSLRRAERG